MRNYRTVCNIYVVISQLIIFVCEGVGSVRVYLCDIAVCFGFVSKQTGNVFAVILYRLFILVVVGLDSGGIRHISAFEKVAYRSIAVVYFVEITVALARHNLPYQHLSCNVLLPGSGACIWVSLRVAVKKYTAKQSYFCISQSCPCPFGI